MSSSCSSETGAHTANPQSSRFQRFSHLFGALGKSAKAGSSCTSQENTSVRGGRASLSSDDSAVPNLPCASSKSFSAGSAAAARSSLFARSPGEVAPKSRANQLKTSAADHSGPIVRSCHPDFARNAVENRSFSSSRPPTGRRESNLPAVSPVVIPSSPFACPDSQGPNSPAAYTGMSSPRVLPSPPPISAQTSFRRANILGASRDGPGRVVSDPAVSRLLAGPEGSPLPASLNADRSDIAVPAGVITTAPLLADHALSSQSMSTSRTPPCGCASAAAAPLPVTPQEFVQGHTANSQVSTPASRTAEQMPSARAAGACNGSRKRTDVVQLAQAPALPPAMQRPQFLLEDFSLVRELHRSALCSVHQAMCSFSMLPVVLKVYDTTRLSELSRTQLTREIELHVGLDHPHILKLYAVWQEGTKVVLLQEYAEGGDLYGALANAGKGAVVRMSEQVAVTTVIAPLLKALQYLHARGILHRDIKLENLLFKDGQHTHLLLADFGIAINLNEERGVTRAGTLDYMSPEVLRCPGKSHPMENKNRSDLWYTHAADTWAVGVLAYEFINGCPPFAAPNDHQTEMQILKLEPTFVVDDASSQAEDFVFGCLSKDPETRPTPLQLLAHPWVRMHVVQQRRPNARFRNRSAADISGALHLERSQSMSTLSPLFSLSPTASVHPAKAAHGQGMGPRNPNAAQLRSDASPSPSASHLHRSVGSLADMYPDAKGRGVLGSSSSSVPLADGSPGGSLHGPAERPLGTAPSVESQDADPDCESLLGLWGGTQPLARSSSSWSLKAPSFSRTSLSAGSSPFVRKASGLQHGSSVAASVAAAYETAPGVCGGGAGSHVALDKSWGAGGPHTHTLRP